MVGCLSALFFVCAVLNFFFGIFVYAQFFIIYLFHCIFIYVGHVLVISNVVDYISQVTLWYCSGSYCIIDWGEPERAPH